MLVVKKAIRVAVATTTPHVCHVYRSTERHLKSYFPPFPIHFLPSLFSNTMKLLNRRFQGNAVRSTGDARVRPVTFTPSWLLSVLKWKEMCHGNLDKIFRLARRPPIQNKPLFIKFPGFQQEVSPTRKNIPWNSTAWLNVITASMWQPTRVLQQDS